jgi:hypothetical protein
MRRGDPIPGLYGWGINCGASPSAQRYWVGGAEISLGAKAHKS